MFVAGWWKSQPGRLTVGGGDTAHGEKSYQKKWEQPYGHSLTIFTNMYSLSHPHPQPQPQPQPSTVNYFSASLPKPFLR